MSPAIFKNVRQSKNHIFHCWPERCNKKNTAPNTVPRDLAHMRGFEGKYFPFDNLRTKKFTGWNVANEEAVLLKNDGWSPMHLWNAVISKCFTRRKMEWNGSFYMKMMFSSHVVGVMELWNPSVSYGIVALNRFGLHLQLFLKNMVQS